jgi:hypothetical protein
MVARNVDMNDLHTSAPVEVVSTSGNFFIAKDGSSKWVSRSDAGLSIRSCETRR